MKKAVIGTLFCVLGGIAGCAHNPPQELIEARQTYQSVSNGPAAVVAPAELHKASESLVAAERAYQDDPDAQRTRDLAYIAQRKALIAQAIANREMESRRKAENERYYESKQGEMIQRVKGDLNQTKARLAQSEQGRREEAFRHSTALNQERQARADAEQKAAEADKRSKEMLEALDKMAQVKEEERGTVITLSGSVLFVTNEATLLPNAQVRLNQVAEALLSTPDRDVLVEGHTDSRGTESYNLDLSRRRAEAVRAYLVSRGYAAEHIRAEGIGKARPIAPNSSADGRANNRRVEIIIQPKAKSEPR
jgi:outer membrane protein OmpA-like peptidoglycan-associated protein